MRTPNKKGLVREHRSKFLALIRLSDISIIGFTLTYLLDYNGLEFTQIRVWLLLITAISFEFFAEFNQLYNAPRGINLFTETQNTISSWLCVSFVLLIVLQFQPGLIAGLGNVFWLWVIVVPVGLIVGHLLSRLFINYCRSIGRNTRRVAIIGATTIGFELEAVFKEETWLGFSFVGYFDDRINLVEERNQKTNKQLAGNVQALVESVDNHQVDIIYITLPLKAEKRIKEILAILSDTTAVVYYVPDLFGFDLIRSKMENLGGIPVISIYDTPFYGVDGFYKRMFDIVLSSIILFLICIPLLIISAGIKITSPGSILFKQRRYGFKGEEVIVWKFRSMDVSEDGDKIPQATKNDPRITKFGRFLRKTSLDELPQFINVLQGKMSIIGPRPHAVAHNELYRGQIKGYMQRHNVKPGITGLAQISGYRGETDTLEKMEGRIHYDMEYIRNWSLMLDIKIFLITIVKGFYSKQAY